MKDIPVTWKHLAALQRLSPQATRALKGGHHAATTTDTERIITEDVIDV